jgi:hypothetical protein
VLAKVDAQAAENSIVAAFNQTLCKQRRHAAAAERKAILAAQCQPVTAEAVEMPDRELEIVGDVIRRRDRIEEAIGDG